MPLRIPVTRDYLGISAGLWARVVGASDSQWPRILEIGNGNGALGER